MNILLPSSFAPVMLANTAAKAALADWLAFLPALGVIIVLTLLVDLAFIAVIVRKQRADRARRA
jgi:hypothetical protein